VLVTASFGHLLPRTLLDRFYPHRRFNVHPSFLPFLRGPAPIQHAIAQQLDTSGVSIAGIRPLNEGIDTGDIWAQRKISVPADVSFRELRDHFSHVGAQMLVDVLRRSMCNAAYPFHQKHDQATYAPLVTTKSTRIDFGLHEASKLWALHRGMGHQRPIHAVLDQPNAPSVQFNDFYVNRARLFDNLINPGEATYDNSTRRLIVRCAKGTEIAVSAVKQQDRKQLPAKEWWNGLPRAGNLVQFR